MILLILAQLCRKTTPFVAESVNCTWCFAGAWFSDQSDCIPDGAGDQRRLAAALLGRWHELLRAGVTAFVPALLLGVLWWGRNVAVYPGLDFLLGTQRHDSIVTGQPTTAAWIEQYGFGYTGEAFAYDISEFWGQFGWMGVLMPSWVYGLLLLFTLLTVIGAGIGVFRRKPQSNRPYSNQSGSVLFHITRPEYHALSRLQRHVRATSVLLSLSVTDPHRRYRRLGMGGIVVTHTPSVSFPSPCSYRCFWHFFLAGLSLMALFRFIVPALAL